MAERAVTLSDAKDQILEAGAQEDLGEYYLWTGDLQKARVNFERALACCEDISRQALSRVYGFDLSAIVPPLLGLVELLLGWPERAMQWERRSIDWARSTAHPYSQALALGLVSLLQCVRVDFKAASECLIPVRQICDQYGFPEGAGWAKQLDGWCHFSLGEKALGLLEMNESIQMLRAVGSFKVMPLRYIVLAEVQLENSNILAAETLIKDALETLKSTNEGWCEPEVYRVAGEVLLKKPNGDPIAAERYLRQAIEIAKAQDAKWWELRATVSLARVLRGTDRRDDARGMLAEIYNWFTEGFDLPDLKEAKALLDKLS